MNELHGYDIEDLQVGETVYYAKKLTEDDMALFAGASGNVGAVCLSEAYAGTSPFKGRIVQEFLTASLISAAITSKFPGPGSVCMSQSMRFNAPVRPGETVNVEITVRYVAVEKSRVALETNCYVGDTLVIEGEALVRTTSAAQRETSQAEVWPR